MQPDPTYRHMGDHSESIEIEYDPTKTSFEQLLATFWQGHQPTYKSSRQYMSAIFYHDEDQKQAALRTKKEVESHRKKQMYTVIAPAETFYTAEDYHQKFDLRKYDEVASVFSDEEIITSPVAAKLNAYLGGFGDYDTLLKEIDGWSLPEKVAERVKKVIKKGDTSHFCGM